MADWPQATAYGSSVLVPPLSGRLARSGPFSIWTPPAPTSGPAMADRQARLPGSGYHRGGVYRLLLRQGRPPDRLRRGGGETAHPAGRP